MNSVIHREKRVQTKEKRKNKKKRGKLVSDVPCVGRYFSKRKKSVKRIFFKKNVTQQACGLLSCVRGKSIKLSSIKLSTHTHIYIYMILSKYHFYTNRVTLDLEKLYLCLFPSSYTLSLIKNKENYKLFCFNPSNTI